MTVILYRTNDGREVVREWIDELDSSVRAKVASRINRLQGGNFGDWKSIGGGLCELRIHFGAGYRIYFTRDGATVVVLLCGGDKSTQSIDIRRAAAFLEEYQNR